MGLKKLMEKLTTVVAAVKCESNTGTEYSVDFLWSPDSV